MVEYFVVLLVCAAHQSHPDKALTFCVTTNQEAVRLFFKHTRSRTENETLLRKVGILPKIKVFHQRLIDVCTQARCSPGVSLPASLPEICAYLYNYLYNYHCVFITQHFNCVTETVNKDGSHINQGKYRACKCVRQLWTVSTF